MFPAAIPNSTKLYVPVAGDNRIDIVTMATNLKVGEIAVGSQPSSVTLSITGAKAYVTNFGDGTISVIDTAADRKIKDIPAPQIPVPQHKILDTEPELIIPVNPWQGAISATNGHLYVTYWGTQNSARFNGVVVEYDTCDDEFERAILDDTARGSAPGSAGATGIAAPAAPLTRDPATGMTTGAGGGGGGPFGITAFPFPGAEGNPPNIARPQVYEPNVLFTNDALGIISGIDARIDQVVTAPAIKIESCPKLRGIAAVQMPSPTILPTHRLYVACGQPDNAVLVVVMPRILRSEIPGFPVITEISPGSKLKLKGSGFAAGTHIEVIELGSAACFALEREPKIKKNGRVFEQKGNLSDGRRLRDVFRRNGAAILRLILPDGSVRLIQPPL
jgi:YVTN family beta-propeller protein